MFDFSHTSSGAVISGAISLMAFFFFKGLSKRKEGMDGGGRSWSFQSLPLLGWQSHARVSPDAQAVHSETHIIIPKLQMKHAASEPDYVVDLTSTKRNQFT